MSESEESLRDLFEEDSDTCDTTLEDSFKSTEDNEEPEEDPEDEPEVSMAADLAKAQKELLCLQQQYLPVQLKAAGWDQDTVTMAEVINAKSRMAQLNLEYDGLFKRIFELSADMAEFKKNRTDLDVIGPAMTKTTEIIAGVIELRRVASTAGAAAGSTTGSNVKLPRLEIPTFDGKIEGWLSFKDLFTAAVSDHSSLSGAQKLQYLMASVKGEAERIVKGFSVTDDNFDKAWALLEKRYDNSRELIFALIRKFVYQPSCTKECPNALKRLIDTSLEAIRSLEGKTNPDEWGPILVFMLMEKMDPDTRREWTKSLSGSDVPSFEDVIDWLGDHVRGLQAAGTVGKSSSSSGVVKSNFSSNSKSKSKSYKCYMCEESHSIYKCDKFTGLSVRDREAFVKSKNLCFNCLSSKHSVKDCESKKSCSHCQKKHNSMLHPATQSEVVHANVASQSGVTSVLLSTAMVKVKDSFGSFRVCRVLLDPGSEASFVTQKCTKLLGLQPSKCDVQVTGISAVKVGKVQGIVGLELSSLIKDFNFEVNCLVYNQVTGRLPSFRCTGEVWEFLRGLPLADPKFLEPREVDILLGADVTGFLSLPGCVKRDQQSPVAMATELGWVISGPAKSVGLVSGADSNSHNYSVRVHHTKVETDELIQKFWELEQVPEHPQWTEEERQCEKHFETAHFRVQGGRYGTPIPFKPKLSKLGLSRFAAMKRLLQVERRLPKSGYKDQYLAFIREYLALGHMEKIPPEECGERLGVTHYLPHHYVLKEESTAIKFRVVFDGSPDTSSGVSFNSCILVGPKVQDDLFHHLLRFRFHVIALKADIVKMFRQFLVSKSDADKQRILWRESPEEEIEEYRLLTVTYGTAYGAHSAARCLKQLSLDYKEECPEAAEVVGRNFYVDDLMTSLPDAESATRLQKVLDELVEKAGLELGKWESNDPKVVEHVPEERRAKNSKFKLEDGKFITKALGVQWDSHNDVLLFQGFEFRNFTRVTKCVVLSEMSRIFDPLGLLAPLTVKIKIFFQTLWMPIESDDGKHRVLAWEEEIPEDLKSEWEVYQKGMLKLGEVRIPRVLCVAGTQRYELHCFSDASEKAYSGVVYLRCFGEDGKITTRIMCAKTKVAPLKSQSIPRLELCGALLLSKLVVSVTTGMLLSCPLYFWTDSELVLKWISGQSRTRNTFVANRVATIQELVPVESWMFIPGEINPADCASRGMTADELVGFDLWWNGPEFLSQPGIPVFVGKGISPSANLEEKRQPKLPVSCGVGIVQEGVLGHNSQVQVPKVYNEWFTKYSDLEKLKRAVAYVLRLRFNWFAKPQDRKVGELTVIELRDAFTVLAKLAQREDYGDELDRLESGKSVRMTSPIQSLNPFVDQDGVMKVGGRLQRSDLPSTTKHQIILSGSHPLTKLLVRHRHLELLHAGFQLLWTSLQREFWIVRARSNIRNLVRNCIMCKRLKAKLAQQLMGSLPPARVIPSRPFSHVGVDYAGPYSLSIAKGRGKRYCTGYFSIFICFATRAVHLEYALELTSESFIGALKRFVARRGMPSHIYSDCGTNFVGAERELKELLTASRFNTDVSRFLSEKGVTWHFNSPAGPHHGGLWEAGVKSVKLHLKRHVGLGAISLEEFSTVLCMVEAALNSRPLCALSSDPTDLDVLTPGHFLIGEPLTAIPEPCLQHLPENRLSRWQRSQQIFQHFWSRWSKEYVHTLQQRNKWRKPLDNMSVGDLVLLKEDNAPPLKWRMGRVVEANPGVDGLVRIVTVKTQTGELKRPIVKLCPLLSKEDQ